jgi:hypothetical protein
VHSTIICNTSEGYGGAFAHCNADVEDCLIRDNCAMGLDRPYHPFPAGGGAFSECGGAVRRSAIIHSLSYGVNAIGGAFRKCTSTVDRNTIAYNTADGPNAYGGGLWECGGRVTNNVIVSNVGYEGGGLGKCTHSILNNTIMYNQAVGSGTQGAGLYSCNGTIKNCIVWGNRAEVGTKQLHSCSTPTYSCIEGSNYGVGSNITDPPVLRDPERGDFHLEQSSPCVDAGGIVGFTVDYDSEARPHDGSPVPRGDGSDFDIGADEWSPGVPEYSLLMQSIGSGAVDPPPGPHLFTERSVVIVSATPKVGWVFDHWNGVIPEWVNPAWIEMNGNRTVTAVFVPGEGWHRLTVTIDGDGTTDPAEGEHVFEGHTDVSLRATAEPGWYFDHWEGDAAGSANPLDVTMDDDKAITAVFLPAQAGYRTLATAVVGGGTIDPPAGEHLCVPNSVILVKATANSGWLFHHWEGHLAGSENPAPLTMNTNKSVTAVFVAIPETHTLTTGVVGYGTVYPPAGTYQFAVGSVVNVQAAAGPGWRFERWGGQVQDSSANPTNVIMNADKVATAVFVENPSEDINGDELLTAVDVQLVINAALGISIAPYIGDVDGDSSVTAIDVQRVINAVLGLL